jgi:hypothetical protein
MAAAVVMVVIERCPFINHALANKRSNKRASNLDLTPARSRLSSALGFSGFLHRWFDGPGHS